jgi:outer membrane protein assembly factor BamB
MNPAETSIGPGNVAALALAWQAPISPDLRCAPVVANGIAYVTSSGGGGTPVTAFAFDLATGALKWKVDYAVPSAKDQAAACIGSPTVGGGLLFVTDYDGYLAALDAGTGATVWSTQLLMVSSGTGFGIFGAPTYSNGVLYVADRSARVTAFDAPTGQVLWRTVQVGQANEIDTSPAVADGLVVVGQFGNCFNGSCGGVYAFDQVTGALRWHAGNTGVPTTHSSIQHSSPTIAGHVIYVGTVDGSLDARDETNGQLLWTGAIGNGSSSTAAVSVTDGLVFMGGNDGRLYAFAIGCGSGGATCTPVWTATLGTRPIYGPPAVANGLVYVVADGIAANIAHVYAFAVHCASAGGTCSPLWNASLNYDLATLGGPALAAIVVDGMVLANGHSSSGPAALLAFRNPVHLVSLAVTPANSSLAKGLDGQFTATGTYSDSTTADLTASSTWSSSDAAVATINGSGLAHAVKRGTTNIRSTNGLVSGSTSLTVGPAQLVSLAVTPANSTLATGLDRQFTATGTYTDGSTGNLTASSTWSSSNAAVATINGFGLAHAVNPGTANITASNGSLNNGTGLTVTANDEPLTITNIGAVSFWSIAFAGVTFTDADPNGNLAQYSATIDWDDRSPPSAAGVYSNPFGGFASAGSHHYAQAGVYTITVTVKDIGGAVASRSTTVTVLRPPIFARPAR